MLFLRKFAHLAFLTVTGASWKASGYQEVVSAFFQAPPLTYRNQ